MLLVQDFRQLVHNYGQQSAEAIRTNCFAKIYLTGQPQEICNELEQALGKFTYKDADQRSATRQLMTADEIRTMSDTEALLIAGAKRPIKLHLHPYYTQRKLRVYAAMPPAPYTETAACVLPRLPLPKVNEDA